MRQSEVLGLAWGDIDWQSGKRQGRRQVGHSSAKLTLDIYSHLMEGAEVEAMGRLQERLMSGV